MTLDQAESGQLTANHWNQPAAAAKRRLTQAWTHLCLHEPSCNALKAWGCESSTNTGQSTEILWIFEFQSENKDLRAVSCILEQDQLYLFI